ncbi:MAG: tetratricopeptide (TPR) repeat protein [Polyangiales bacterium]|jgi:tetratricopeptide (TPR) repeat protein
MGPKGDGASTWRAAACGQKDRRVGVDDSNAGGARRGEVLSLRAHSQSEREQQAANQQGHVATIGERPNRPKSVTSCRIVGALGSPGDSPAMGDKANLAGDSRQMEERALTMRVLRHQNVGDSEEPVMLAQDLVSANRLRDARLVCMTALHKDPSDVDLLLTGAGIAESLGEHVDARTLLVKAARQVPEWIEPMLRLSRQLFRMEDFGRAWAAVERCYAMDPTNAQACALRADIEQAHRLTLRKDRFLDDEHADDAAMLANALVADSRFDDALTVLDYALERDGEDADALFVKGTILKARGERELAEVALRRVTQMECGWVEAWETMADLLEENGDVAHAERLRAHAATIEVDPLMLVDMAVIAGAHEAVFDDLTMSEDLDRAVAAGVSAMSDLKRSIVSARGSLPAVPFEDVNLQGIPNPAMLIRGVGAMFTREAAPATQAAVLTAAETDFAPVEPVLIPGVRILVDDVSDPNPMKLLSGGKTLPLGTYKPTMPADKAVTSHATIAITTQCKTKAKAKTEQTASGFTAAPILRDSSRPGPRQNCGDAREDAPIRSGTKTMPLTPMVYVDKVHAKEAALPSSPLAPAAIRNPVSVRRIIDVRGHDNGRREEVCVIRDGEAKPLSTLAEETEADLDALLSDDAVFPAVVAATSDEDLFPIDAEAAAFASIDIEFDFSIDAEAERFPSIDIDVAPLSEPPAAPEASTRYQIFADYIKGQEFGRSGAGAHHVGFVATDAFDAPHSALRVHDGKVTLESAERSGDEKQETVEVSTETQEALAELMEAQVSLELSAESKVVFEELLSLVEATVDESDPFDTLQAEGADTVFDAAPAFVETTLSPVLVLQSAVPQTLAPDVVVPRADLSRDEDEEHVAIPLAVRKKPARKKPVLRTRQSPEEDLDLRSQILAAAGVDSNALDTALQATRLPGDLKKAEEELDCFIDEVVVKRPRLRMRSPKGAPYRPPSPRDLFPRHIREDEANELNA